jgi:2-polyprenyl-3-methyl-5-hydroxy-6-metoxy-1,4-benzoquinol methylase
MNCPICKSEGVNGVMQLYDDRYGYPGQFTLMKCRNCGHLFLNCDLSPSQLTELYTNYYPRKSFDVAEYKPYTEESGLVAWINGLDCSAFRWVPSNVRVLDVGCGFGESLGYHTARGCDVYGVEADEHIRRVMEKFGYKIHVGLFDDKAYAQDFFDFITMDQVIEHVADPITTLRGVARILKPGGRAILSTPNACGWGARLFGKRWINWHSPYHLQFFSRQSMRLAAQQAGLVLTEVRTITNSEWLLYQWIHLVTYPKLGEPSWFWSPNKSSQVFHQKILGRFFSLLHKTKINHLATRFFDGLAIGDNFVFVLKKP